MTKKLKASDLFSMKEVFTEVLNRESAKKKNALKLGRKKCSNEDCEIYPYYGVAPHKCYYKRGPEFTIGQSEILPVKTWPKNFIPDLEPGEAAETAVAPCGVYYCPDCMRGYKEGGGSD